MRTVEKQAIQRRLEKVYRAGTEEMAQVNQRLGDVEVFICTPFGEHQLDWVAPGYQYLCHPEGETACPANLRILGGCNDGVWATIMVAAGVPRHPQYEERPRARGKRWRR